METHFEITKEEEKKIQEWLSELHLKENSAYFGFTGGDVSFEFKPTTLGVLGFVHCKGHYYCFRGI